MEDRQRRAAAMVRAILSLGHASLRASYVAGLVRRSPTRVLAQALDLVCERAEQAETPAREALVAIVDALNSQGMDDLVQSLRDAASADSLLSLERLIRSPARRPRCPTSDPPPRESTSKLVVAARGQPLTLGERKSLARRPDRDTLQRLMADPHPDVIHRCLANPRTTEDDVVRLAARRPGRGDVLTEIARSRWVHRPRVRMSLVMNPGTPVEIVAPIVGLLLRPELEVTARSPGVPQLVRALCLEHLERRPPVEARRPSESLQ